MSPFCKAVRANRRSRLAACSGMRLIVPIGDSNAGAASRTISTGYPQLS